MVSFDNIPQAQLFQLPFNHGQSFRPSDKIYVCRGLKVIKIGLGPHLIHFKWVV
jgi:hypothetical protein